MEAMGVGVERKVVRRMPVGEGVRVTFTVSSMSAGGGVSTGGMYDRGRDRIEDREV